MVLKSFRAAVIYLRISRYFFYLDIKNYHDHLTICVQAVALVRRLVCNNKFLVCAANIDLVQNVINLCRLHFDESNRCCYGNRSYPTTATLLLQSLVHGKNLIGKVCELSSKISEDILDSTLGQGWYFLSNGQLIFNILLQLNILPFFFKM